MKKYFTSATRIIIFACLLFGAQSVLALTISPPVKELGGDPGLKIQQIVKLYNETNSEITVWPSTANFKAKEDGAGEPSFTDMDNATTDLASWIKISDGPITVKPLDWQNIIFEIDIPADAEPGGHYAAVFFSPNKNLEAEGGKVSVDYRAGSLILLSISGDVKSSGQLKSWTLLGKQHFYDYTPVNFELRIENDGNVHFRPGGTIEIKNLFNQKVAELPIVKSEAGGNVLPSSTRSYAIIWGEEDIKNLPVGFWNKVKFEWNNFHLGRYVATTAVILPQGPSERLSVAFWIIPWQLLVTELIGLLILWLIFRTYNRWIIKKAREKK